MNMNEIKRVHIIGIGGCASSAIAEYLVNRGIKVSGSEQKPRGGLEYLEELGVKIAFSHSPSNLDLNGEPSIVLYSPAIMALNPNNPEVLAAKERKIELMSWQQFIGPFLNSLGKTGITVSGSEGKGTTAGILTMLLKGTEHDPLSILGAKIKMLDGSSDSNIYLGEGGSYILEGDEFNRNFFNYSPSINIMINFEYEHPETYKDFKEYKEAFAEYFSHMSGERTLILRATWNTVHFVEEYKLDEKHPIIWFGTTAQKRKVRGNKKFYTITDNSLTPVGSTFSLQKGVKKYDFSIPALPGYIVNNAAGAIIAAMELGYNVREINARLQSFKGMLRRFDLYKTRKGGIFITDYGHSPESISHVTKEIRTIFPDKKLHIVFQPHLFSRSFNFFDGFVESLTGADRVSLVDIYPAREHAADWEGKVSAEMMVKALKAKGQAAVYAGKSSELPALAESISEEEITCFIGAGDMDHKFPELFAKFGAEHYFD